MDIEIPTGSYLNAKTCQQGDTVVFLDEGEQGEITDQKTNKPKKIYNFRVSCNKKEYVYSPNNKSLGMITEQLGKDSKTWVGKTFKVKIVTMEYRGKELEVIRPDFTTSKQ